MLFLNIRIRRLLSLDFDRKQNELFKKKTLSWFLKKNKDKIVPSGHTQIKCASDIFLIIWF